MITMNALQDNSDYLLLRLRSFQKNHHFMYVSKDGFVFGTFNIDVIEFSTAFHVGSFFFISQV